MHLLYDDLTWRLEEKINTIDFVFAREIKSPAPALRDFDPLLALELNTNTIPADNGCQIWIGLIQYRYAKASYPYIIPNRAPYGATISVRQAVIARHINLHYSQLPKFRVSMLCNDDRCIAVEHMIPTSYRSRRHHRAMSDATDRRELQRAFTRSELEEEARNMQDRLERGEPTFVDRKPVDIEALLPKSTITPERQQQIDEEYNRAMQWRDATIEYKKWLDSIRTEATTTLEDILPTKNETN